MAEIGKTCWHCGQEASPSLDYEAVLVPRSAGRGGPVFIYLCSGCGLENLVERNAAQEILLSPPTVARVRSPTIRGEARYAARKWETEHGRKRAEFLGRPAPDRPAVGEPSANRAREGEPAEAARESEPASPAATGRSGEGEEDRSAALREAGTILEAYEVLGLPLNATPKEIRKRYRELSKKCHPDRVADLDEEIRRVADRRFRRLKKSYELLLPE